jgi:hypothetical protein
MAEDKGCPEENSGLQKQHSNHEAQMQSQKAGNEQGQTESAVEDDVHNLGESFSFTRLIYASQSEAVWESEAVAEKSFDRALSLAKAAWSERSIWLKPVLWIGRREDFEKSRCNLEWRCHLEALAAARGVAS